MLRTEVLHTTWLIFGAVALLLASACGREQTLKSGTLARVGDEILTAANIPHEIYAGKTLEDSAKDVKIYVESWLRNAILYRYAELQIGKNNPQIERQVADYRRSMYTHAFESEYIQRKLDTAVKDEELQDFYQQNQNLFTLKNTIVRVLLLSIPENSPHLDEVKQLYTLPNGDASLQKLSSLSLKAGAQFLIMPDVWIPITALANFLPADINISFANRRAKNAQFLDNTTLYLLAFQEWKGVGDLAPFDYVQKEVRSIILNRRETNLLRDLEDRIINEGKSDKDVEIYH